MSDPFELKPTENLDDIFSAIANDPDWIFIIADETKKQIYADRLKNSATYVCYSNKNFCGYIRAIIDKGMALYISELFVKPEYRNRKIGQQLMEAVKANSPITVYALSDEDRYYEKKGYKKIGSVFEM